MKRLRGLGTVFSVLMFACIAAMVCDPVRAWAQSDCDTTVVDDARVFSDGVGVIESAVQELQSRGATVRVRTITSYGQSASLDHYEAAIERRCPSWQTPEGGTRNSLIVLISSMQERQVGIYSGDQWKHVIAPNWAVIQERQVKPRFRDGDIAGGFAAGLKEIGRLIDQTNAPTSVAAAGGAPVIVHVSQSAPTTPTDFSGLWNVMGWLLGLLALAAIVLFVLHLRKLRAERQEAQHAAKLTKGQLVALIQQATDAMSTIGIRAGALAKQVSPADAAKFQVPLKRAEELRGRAEEQFTGVVRGDGDPNRDGLTTEQYRTTKASIERVLKIAEEALAAIRETESEMRAFEQLVAEMPQRVAAVEQDLERAATAIKELFGAGFKPGDTETTLGLARECHGRARDALTERRYGDAVREATHATETAKAAEHTACEIPKRLARIILAITAAEARKTATERLLADGAASFDRISSGHPETAWESIAGNGSEAERRIDSCVPAITIAKNVSTMTVQNWTLAEQTLGEVAVALNEATRLIEAIMTLERQLIEAKRIAQPEIEAAAADIDRASAFERVHDDDVDDALKVEVRQAVAMLAQAKAELAEARPNYLRVVKLARNANAAADGILATAQNQYEAAERLRQRAASMYSEAETSISTATRYIQNHAGDVGSTARSGLANAQAALDRVRAALGNPQQILTHATQADADADGAYNRARRDVASAEETRAAAARAAAAAIAGAHRAAERRQSQQWGGYSSPSGRSGGSSSFGSSGRSGGSSSFGGGGGRSGGSSGW